MVMEFEKIKKFLLYFSAIFFVPYLLIIYEILPTYTINKWIADVLFISLSQSFPIFLFDNHILSDSISFTIVPDCSGFVMISMFFALVMSSNSKITKKITSIIIISPFLFLFNLLRLFLTLYIGLSFGKFAFEITHILLWFIDSGVVILFWLFSLKKIMKVKIVDAIQYQ